MKKKIKVGLIGLGGICNAGHMPSYEKMDNVEVAAICDILPERIENFKNKYSLDVPSFTDYKDLLNMKDLDFVDICTPNYLHSIISVEALEHGLHVFCEKPDAISVEEAIRMKNASEKYNKQLMVVRNNRHKGVSKYLKKYIEDGKMGDIYCGRCGWQRRRGIPGKGGWFTTKAQSGGGPLIDLGVHMIDLAIWLMGNPKPISVSGCTYNKFADTNVSDSIHSNFGDKKENGIFDVEDLAMGFIKFDNGACLQFEFSWASNIEKESNFVELRGTKSGARLEGKNLSIFTETNGYLENINPIISDDGNYHAENIKHFINVITNGEKADFEPIQGVNMIKILSAIYESAENGKEVLL